MINTLRWIEVKLSYITHTFDKFLVTIEDNSIYKKLYFIILKVKVF